jgi:hypothetical protein
MSYDLYLFPRPGAPPLGRQAFLDYFEGDLYERSDDGVRYSNPDTGVYFTFSYSEGGEDDFRARPHVHFNLNYFRPHTFGLEAERVLTPFARHFDLVVDDPQTEGMGQGEYTGEGFLRGWDAGNRFAHQAMRAMRPAGGAEVLALPAEVNRKLWDWNYHRARFSEELAEFEDVGVFAPCILFFREGGRARTFCVFPNLVPTAVPRVDRVFILRNELSPPHDTQSQDTPAWVRWDELRQAAAGFRVTDDNTDLEYLLLFGGDYLDKDSAPDGLARWVIALPDWPGRPDVVSPDQVLDEELLAAGPDAP